MHSVEQAVLVCTFSEVSYNKTQLLYILLSY